MKHWRNRKRFRVWLKREFRIKKPISWMKFQCWLPDFFCFYVLTGWFAYVLFSLGLKPVFGFSDRGSCSDLFSFSTIFLCDACGAQWAEIVFTSFQYSLTSSSFTRRRNVQLELRWWRDRFGVVQRCQMIYTEKTGNHSSQFIFAFIILSII